MSNHSASQPLLIKLGGSLYNTAELILWLKALKKLSEQHTIIIVPGGGPFADQVRTAQSKHKFDDKTAHHMAIMAMKQFGLLIQALEAHCQTFHDHSPSLPPLSVWLPDDSLLAEQTIAHSWDISSDSLALWLANKLNAQRLTLIKRVMTHSHSIAQLSLGGVIDSGFANLYSQHPIATQIIHYQQHQAFSDSRHSIHNTISLSLS